MAVDILEPVGLTLTTTLADLGTETPADNARHVNVRVTNIGTADVYVDLYLDKVADGTKSHYRAKNHLVPYQSGDSTQDLEFGLFVPAGWKLRAKASAATSAVMSLTGVNRG